MKNRVIKKNQKISELVKKLDAGNFSDNYFHDFNVFYIFNQVDVAEKNEILAIMREDKAIIATLLNEGILHDSFQLILCSCIFFSQ